MSEDILRESWVYQEIVEQGIEEGKKQGKIQGQRELLLSFVQRHFPDAMALAKRQVDSITDSEVLLAVFLKLLDAQTAEEVNKILLEVDNSKNKR